LSFANDKVKGNEFVGDVQQVLWFFAFRRVKSKVRGVGEGVHSCKDCNNLCNFLHLEKRSNTRIVDEGAQSYEASATNLEVV
jgi:hypothetical protein